MYNVGDVITENSESPTRYRLGEEVEFFEGGYLIALGRVTLVKELANAYRFFIKIVSTMG